MHVKQWQVVYYAFEVHLLSDGPTVIIFQVWIFPVMKGFLLVIFKYINQRQCLWYYFFVSTTVSYGLFFWIQSYKLCSNIAPCTGYPVCTDLAWLFIFLFPPNGSFFFSKYINWLKFIQAVEVMKLHAVSSTRVEAYKWLNIYVFLSTQLFSKPSLKSLLEIDGQIVSRTFYQFCLLRVLYC